MTSTKASLLALGITSLLCSRALFLFINDPEGPNLLVVLGLAAMVYLVSLAVYALAASLGRYQKLGLAVTAQALAVAGLYLLS